MRWIDENAETYKTFSVEFQEDEDEDEENDDNKEEDNHKKAKTYRVGFIDSY